MILRFGNVTLLSLEELSGKLFTGPGNKMNIMLEGGRWEQHPLDITVYGINVEVSACVSLYVCVYASVCIHVCVHVCLCTHVLYS